MELKHKLYSPFDEETIKKAFSETKGEYVNIIPFEVDDKFLFIYREQDSTQPPSEDIIKYSPPTKQNQDLYEHPVIDSSLFALTKQFWFISVPVTAFVIYWFFLKGK